MTRRNLSNHHYTDQGDYIKCTLENGRNFIFDKSDWPIVQGRSWSVDKYGYVNHWENGRNFKLHRLLMGNIALSVDHINGDPWDNRRCNLRFATPKQNARNAGLRKDSSTGYKGVHYRKDRNRFTALIRVDGKMKYLGSFRDPMKAAKAYDRAAAFYFDDYARLNFRRKEEGQHG